MDLRNSIKIGDNTNDSLTKTKDGCSNTQLKSPLKKHTTKMVQLNLNSSHHNSECLPHNESICDRNNPVFSSINVIYEE